MGLSTVLRNLSGRLAAAVAHEPCVLLAVCPGATAARWEAEAAVPVLGGRLADSPAQADVLLVVGTPSPPMRSVIDTLWGQMPGPRVRGEVVRPGQAETVLRRVLLALADARQVAEAARRDDEWNLTEQADENGRSGGHEGHGEHGGGEDGSADADGSDGQEGGRGGDHGREGGDGDEDGRGGHEDHGESGMRMPGGLPMADRAEDRDGLKLDVLHVPLGPVLPYWPAGLVIDTVLQGDVVQRADGRVLTCAGSRRPPFWDAGEGPAALGARTAACHLDSLGRLLALAGSESAAVVAHRLRDRLLAREPESAVHADFGPWRRRVERSRLLRWATDGLGVLTPADAVRLGVGGPAARAEAPHDATARWRQWLAETDDLLTGQPVPEGGPRGRPVATGPPSRGLLAAATELMPGLDLTAARLLVASLDPDPDELAEPESEGTGSGEGAR